MMLILGLTLILQEKLKPYQEVKLEISQSSYSSILETTKTTESTLEVKSPNMKWTFNDQTWFINDKEVFIKQEDGSFLKGKNVFPLQDLFKLDKKYKVTKINDNSFKVKSDKYDFTLNFIQKVLSEIILTDDLDNKTTFKIKNQEFKSSLKKFSPPKDAKISDLGGM